MKIMILYETIEGQTAKVAQFASDVLEDAGHEVECINLADTIENPSVEGADKVILAGSVHERRHPRAFEVYLAAEKSALAAVPTLLISVSLNAAFPEGREEAGEYVIELKMRTGFEPSAELLVAGAVKTSKYDYFASQVVKHVLLQDRIAEAGEGECEFTDWDALAEALARFADTG